MVLTCWVGCHKDNDPSAQEPEVTDVKVTPKQTGASFIWSAVMPGKFQTGVEVSEHENMRNPLSLEAYENDGRFVASINSLSPNTTYYYRIVVWNKFKRFEFEKDGTGFTTLDTPPTPGQDTVYYDITASVNFPEGGTATGGGRFAEGDTCRVIATANTGYIFVNWTENESQVSTDSVFVFTVTGNRDLVANFREEDAVLYTVITKAEPVEGGTVTGGGMFHYGDTIALSATPNANFNFEGWSDGSTDNPREVVVTGNATFKAIFSEAGAVYYNVITHVVPDGAGSVTGGGPHPEGLQIQLSANANTEAGYLFEKWDDGNTDNPRTITVNSDMEFTAYFKKKTYTVTVQASTGGTAHIGDMTGTIEATFEHGESCTVHALPETGYIFVNWTENGTEASTEENYSFIVTSNHNLMANFQQQQYWIGTSVDPTSSGSVSGGNRYYNHGEQCNLTATVSEQYEFDHWTKNGSSYPGGSTITFTVTEAASYSAHFRLKQYTITVSASTGGSAHVGSPTGPTTVTYTSGQQCTVYAVANSNYTFSNWTEGGNAVSSQANYTFTVTGNRTLVANFTPQVTLPTVTTSQVTNIQQTTATGGGNVTNNGGATVTTRGICWSTSHNPTIANSHQNSGSGTGIFTANMSGLSPGTIYYVRAYATNSAGTGYGSEVTFTTLSSGGTHAYVDLGLPSGLLWATCNIGADSPEEYGDYFAWGETQPKSDYSWSTYQYANGTSYTDPQLTKYCSNSNYGYNGFTDNLTTLLPEDDAATTNWGTDWRMPTIEEWQELFQYTTHIWTTLNGVHGGLFTATNGNSLFLPAAGFRRDDILDDFGTRCDYWSSSLNTDSPNCARGITFFSYASGLDNCFRCYGQSVRPVRSSRQN